MALIHFKESMTEFMNFSLSLFVKGHVEYFIINWSGYDKFGCFRHIRWIINPKKYESIIFQ